METGKFTNGGVEYGNNIKALLENQMEPGHALRLATLKMQQNVYPHRDAEFADAALLQPLVSVLSRPRLGIMFREVDGEYPFLRILGNDVEALLDNEEVARRIVDKDGSFDLQKRIYELSRRIILDNAKFRRERLKKSVQAITVEPELPNYTGRLDDVDARIILWRHKRVMEKRRRLIGKSLREVRRRVLNLGNIY